MDATQLGGLARCLPQEEELTYRRKWIENQNEAWKAERNTPVFWTFRSGFVQTNYIYYGANAISRVRIYA
jgi:hypothetical protein